MLQNACEAPEVTQPVSILRTLSRIIIVLDSERFLDFDVVSLGSLTYAVVKIETTRTDTYDTLLYLY